MDDFDLAQSKIGESAQRVVDRAIEDTRRRDDQLVVEAIGPRLIATPNPDAIAVRRRTTEAPAD